MYDYFNALQQRFFQEPDFEELKQEMESLYHELHGKLDRDDQRRLLKLVDTQIHLRDEISLAAFIAGFRLAHGIERELGREAAYSFEKEEEMRIGG